MNQKNDAHRFISSLHLAARCGHVKLASYSDASETALACWECMHASRPTGSTQERPSAFDIRSILDLRQVLLPLQRTRPAASSSGPTVFLQCQVPHERAETPLVHYVLYDVSSWLVTTYTRDNTWKVFEMEGVTIYTSVMYKIMYERVQRGMVEVQQSGWRDLLFYLQVRFASAHGTSRWETTIPCISNGVTNGFKH